MRSKLTHIIQRAFLLILALQVLNLSTNAIDFQPMQTAYLGLYEFNDLNTITEYFAEEVLGKKDAFPEPVHKEQKASQLQKHVSVKLLNTTADFTIVRHDNLSSPITLCYSEDNIRLFATEIVPPPPKC